MADEVLCHVTLLASLLAGRPRQPHPAGAAAPPFIQGYNAVIAVDGAHQIIVTQRLQTSPADGRAKPLRAATRNVLRANPVEVSADAGFCDEGQSRASGPTQAQRLPHARSRPPSAGRCRRPGG